MVMGAKFSPSYANLFISYWELQNIWANNPYGGNLVLYARYIEKILIIWNGTDEELEGFFAHYSSKPFGISFTHVVDDIFHFKYISGHTKQYITQFIVQ